REVDGQNARRHLSRPRPPLELSLNRGDQQSREPFHLLLQPETGQTISRILQSLTVAHTWRYHKRHRSSGHVWQGRFKSPAIQDDAHLLVVLRHIEANPSGAKLVSAPAEYRWSNDSYHRLLRPILF